MKKRILGVLLAVLLVVGLMPGMAQTAYGAVSDISISEVELHEDNSLKTFTLTFSWQGGQGNIAFVLLDNEIVLPEGSGGYYSYFAVDESRRKSSFDASLSYIAQEFDCKKILGFGEGFDTYSTTHSPEPSAQEPITITINKGSLPIQEGKMYFYEWRYNASLGAYYPDALVATFEFTDDGFTYQSASAATASTVEYSTYTVTVTPGSNMTKTTDSGDATQDVVVSKAMTNVVYTANDDYYFPETYSVEGVNGVSVARNSYTQITVSGKPTADAPITLTAPMAKTKPEAPTAAAENCTTTDNNDGKLTGITTEMEYKKSDADHWTDGTGSDITELVPGTYYVRVKATDTTLASDNQELTIKGFVEHTVKFIVVNGSWDDETDTEKEVTLTGYEGDELKLASEQIPAVGNMPAVDYKAGSWDTEPNTDTAITAETTYTYTYAPKGAQMIEAEEVSATYGDTDKSVSASVSDPATGGGAISYAVKEGSEAYIEVDETSGSLTIKKVPADGKAYVIVTAAENEEYLEATKEVTVTIAHQITEVAEVPATCEEDGVKQHWIDEEGNLYQDAEGKETVTEAELVIEALNHDWNEPTYEWAADNSTVTATRTCKHDENHVQEETVNTTSEVTKAAECEAKGETTYTATFENEAFEKQEKTVEDIDALDHDWEEPTYEWAEDNSAVTATRVCKNDASHLETETVVTTSKVTKEATEAEEGETTYTATFKNPAFTEQTKTESIPKLEPEEEVTYSNTKGNGTQWTKGSTATADFTFTRSQNDSETFSHFTGIQVDGKDVAASNYTAESGSVIVKLKPAYLETLSAGEHTLTALFDDGGAASAKFTIAEKSTDTDPEKEIDPDPDTDSKTPTGPEKEESGENSGKTTPKTGDSRSVLLWLAILCASVLVLFHAINARRRNSYGHR